MGMNTFLLILHLCPIVAHYKWTVDTGIKENSHFLYINSTPLKFYYIHETPTKALWIKNTPTEDFEGFISPQSLIKRPTLDACVLNIMSHTD